MYICPEFGYDLKTCLNCDGPKARCVSHYSLPFRWAKLFVARGVFVALGEPTGDCDP